MSDQDKEAQTEQRTPEAVTPLTPEQVDAAVDRWRLLPHEKPRFAEWDTHYREMLGKAGMVQELRKKAESLGLPEDEVYAGIERAAVSAIRGQGFITPREIANSVEKFLKREHPDQQVETGKPAIRGRG